jgi:hypothetical protein
MRLSEAILEGSKLRPEAPHNGAGDRFVRVANTGELRSDAWGAACETVQPAVANFNWNHNQPFKYAAAKDALCAIQDHYFEHYWQLPAQCPGSQQRFTKVGGRLLKKDDPDSLKTYDDYAVTENAGGITSECDKVQHLAGMVDHLFYMHGWSREKVAAAVASYEDIRTAAAIAVNFSHTSVAQDKYVRTLIKPAANGGAR